MRQQPGVEKIERATLTRARFNADLTGRELARRAARRLGVAAREVALQQSLSRAERGQAVWLDASELDALAAELGLRHGADLTKPYRWVFKNTGSYYANKTHDPIAWLDGHLPAFSDAHGAWQARGWVTFAEGRVLPPLDMCGIYEVFHTELMAELGSDESRLALDPSYAAFCGLAGVEVRTAV
jgi:transcriptional regulator with XRE-family HTH domain